MLLISDEIYDEFTYQDAKEPSPLGHTGGKPVCPSPARFPGAAHNVLIVRGFGKTYGVTGWRLGYAAGPRPLIEEMNKLQQYTFVCAPAPLQHGVLAALDYDMREHIDEYRRRRDHVVSKLERESLIRLPHEGWSSGTPSPRNDRYASNRMFAGTSREAYTIRGDSRLGRI